MPTDEYGPVQEVFRGTSGITKVQVNGRPVFFLQTHFRDVIQREHQAGRFYEPEELHLIRTFFPTGGVFCDIGANVGNHSLYVGLFLEPSRIICFEPNPAIIPTLRANILLNGLEDICDLEHLGLGLSSSFQDRLGMVFGARNVGAGRLRANMGDLRTVPGDSLLADRRVDFIKLDVEGMELDVLRGLAQTIAASRPVIFVECANLNIDPVIDMLGAWGYSKMAEWRRYEQNINLLFQPDASSDAKP